MTFRRQRENVRVSAVPLAPPKVVGQQLRCCPTTVTRPFSDMRLKMAVGDFRQLLAIFAHSAAGAGGTGRVMGAAASLLLPP
eukprot:NODE_3626_length_903_cov_3.428571_g3019_i0.p4 GENE.NODE_3626_length_903_cov_3.428571_g3019_i0~~NODE_3626_length_903_cov_3.428571_g3019_i0.p4  ORF type:complete len:82 (+),score=2.27 NODE_3626_length_903_cov_3.428571_g3019_i0:99-344(+)